MALKTHSTDESSSQHPAADVETVVVDPADILSAFRRNRRDELEQQTHVLRIHPSFDGEKQASLFASRGNKHYPAEMDPKPIHLPPRAFVGGERGLPDQCQVPDYARERRKFLDENGYVDEKTGEYQDWTDEMESEFDEWWDVVTEVWEDNVRNALADEITLSYTYPDGNASTTVAVRYL